MTVSIRNLIRINKQFKLFNLLSITFCSKKVSSFFFLCDCTVTSSILTQTHTTVSTLLNLFPQPRTKQFIISTVLYITLFSHGLFTLIWGRLSSLSYPRFLCASSFTIGRTPENLDITFEENLCKYRDVYLP